MKTDMLKRFTLSDLQQHSRPNVLDKARLDPVLIEGHYTDLVLMSKTEYESLVKQSFPVDRPKGASVRPTGDKK